MKEAAACQSVLAYFKGKIIPEGSSVVAVDGMISESGMIIKKKKRRKNWKFERFLDGIVHVHCAHEFYWTQYLRRGRVSLTK